MYTEWLHSVTEICVCNLLFHRPAVWEGRREGERER